ncbi:MAG: tRNA (adenosine(37)-N6)-threonylcarbamoyltransferase complex transferase subunit TsaD, partial [Candidatus Omnitrophica bacterium]|nr:tRNA (adenosine(37)-N6)-threonylcarbamoyltransferase complex transferase subunit TsaD [Candidatus Omnitrophota bacterium]
AKILGLGYPGGPVIERRAALSSGGSGLRFNCSAAGSRYGFSFSGIKTAVLYYVSSLKRSGARVPAGTVNDIAYAFQEAVVGTLADKTFAAASDRHLRDILVGGGVAANSRLRREFERRAAKTRIKVFFPEKRFCLDNGAMIACLGRSLYRKGVRAGTELGLDLD